MRTRAATGAVVAISWAAVASGQVPVGPEFQVNTYTLSGQYGPSVASDAAGNFVVAWTDVSRDGQLEGVSARRFDASGTALGGEFQVNTHTLEYQFGPVVAMNPTGGFVVVWTSFYQDGSGYGIYAQRYDAAGAPIGPEFRVNSTTTGDQTGPRVATDPAGNFVVVWTRGYPLPHDVMGRRYDASGSPAGAEFVINTYTTSDQHATAVGMDAAGNFAVVWTSWHQDGSQAGVFGQRFDAAGTRVGSEFRVNTETSNSQLAAGLAVAPDGGFVVTWTGLSHDGLGDVFGQRYDATGESVGSEFQVNGYTTARQSGGRVAREPGGGFVVAWESEGQDGSGYGVFGRRFDASGIPQGTEFRVNAHTTAAQRWLQLASQGDGSFLVVWTSSGQDGSGNGIFGQRFETETDFIFADDFESGTLAAWSGAETGGGDLSVSPGAALGSTTAGLQAVVDDPAALYVEDTSAEDEGRYRARFYFDPNGVDPGEAEAHHRTRIFLGFGDAPARRLFAIVLHRRDGSYRVMGRARRDDDTQADTEFFPISDDPHFVEIDWHRSSAVNSSDGFLHLWIDGIPAGSLTALDNSRGGIDFVRLGALSVKSGANGTMYWDEFESRRSSFIGP